MLCKLLKLLIFFALCLYVVRRSLCHCKTPAKINIIVHISAEFLKMKVFPQVLIPLIAEALFTCEMLCLNSCPKKVSAELSSNVCLFDRARVVKILGRP